MASHLSVCAGVLAPELAATTASTKPRPARAMPAGSTPPSRVSTPRTTVRRGEVTHTSASARRPVANKPVMRCSHEVLGGVDMGRKLRTDASATTPDDAL